MYLRERIDGVHTTIMAKTGNVGVFSDALKKYIYIFLN